MGEQKVSLTHCASFPRRSRALADESWVCGTYVAHRQWWICSIHTQQGLGFNFVWRFENRAVLLSKSEAHLWLYVSMCCVLCKIHSPRNCGCISYWSVIGCISYWSCDWLHLLLVCDWLHLLLVLWLAASPIGLWLAASPIGLWLAASPIGLWLAASPIGLWLAGASPTGLWLVVKVSLSQQPLGREKVCRWVT